MALEIDVKKAPSNVSTSGAKLHRINAFDIKDPALATRWFVYVPDAGTIYQCVAEKVTATFPKIPAKSRFTHGSNDFFPDINEIDGVSISFYETYDYDVTRWLSRWRGMVVHTDGTYGVPAQYKKEIIVELLLPGSDTPSITLTYKGCWPTDKGAFNLSYEDDTGRTIIEAQFSTDSMEMK